MYFPYLRGKQFELIAIRELIEKHLIGNKIFPIIEPIKLTSTLKKTIDIADSNEFRLALIFNPEVGNVVQKRDEIFETYSANIANNCLMYGYIINKGMQEDILNLINQNIINYDQILLVHTKDSFADEYKATFLNSYPSYNLIPDQRTYGRKVKENKVLFVDHFIMQKRNSDYANEIDEFFSEDHLFYNDEGFKGFSDYCMIGSKYADGGFRPYAVAIHITYFDDDNILRVLHFVSDTNDDASDTPRKYYEALGKLIEWKETSGINTYALGVFQEHFDNQTYPGLGTLKKLAIMHHIELVNQFLETIN